MRVGGTLQNRRTPFMSEEIYDPTKALAAILTLLKKFEKSEPDPDQAQAAAREILKLHNYIAAGGDLPKQWDPCLECDETMADQKRRCLRHGKLVPKRRPTLVPGLLSGL